MNIVLFIIFLIANLTTVGVSMFSYGDRSKYIRGMIMGVHIPQDKVNHAEVQKICQENKRIWDKFQRINLILSVGLCFIVFWTLELFMILWIVWIFGYIAYLNYLVLKPHRQMYRLKMEQQWMDEKTKHLVYVDLKTSAHTQKMVFSWKYHLVLLSVIILSGMILFLEKNKCMYELSGWIFWFMTMFVAVTMLVMQIWFIGRRNEVYSQNSEINYAINQTEKRSWSIMLFAVNVINTIAWLFLAFRMHTELWIFSMDVIIYLVLQSVAMLFFIIPLFYMPKKRNKILEMDKEPVYVDDDEYWKTGFYYNPNDKRILVQDRMCSTNYSFNMARPISVVLTGGVIVLIAGIIVWISAVMISFSTAKTSVEIEDSHVKIKAAMYNCEFTVEEIETIELLDEMPEENFFKTNGGATDDYSIGHFSGNKSGACMLFLHNKADSPIMKIVLKGKVVFLNSEEKGQVEIWYDKLTGIM